MNKCLQNASLEGYVSLPQVLMKGLLMKEERNFSFILSMSANENANSNSLSPRALHPASLAESLARTLLMPVGLYGVHSLSVVLIIRNPVTHWDTEACLHLHTPNLLQASPSLQFSPPLFSGLSPLPGHPSAWLLTRICV